MQHVTSITRGTTAAVAGLLVSLAACSSADKKASTDSAATAAAAAASTATPTPSTPDSTQAAAAGASNQQMSDANILAKEAAGDSAEVVLAGIAENKATDPAVKAYAKLLASDHGKGLKETKALAQKLSITPQTPAGDTTALSTSHVRERLQGMQKGPAFDTAFVNHEIQDHQQDLKDAHDMSAAAKDASVKNMIEKSIPELQKHLDKAQSIADKAGKSGKP